MTHPGAACLGDLTETVATWNPTRSPDEQFDYIDLSSVDQDRKLVSGATRLLTNDAPSRARQLVSHGDVLVSTVRPNLNGVAVVPESLESATASTGFTVLRPGSRLEGRYLFHWVRSPQFIGDMVRKATGASYPAVSDGIVKASSIPLPSLDEQRRIAAILDQADALRAKRRDALAHLDDLTQSIFLDMFGDPVENPRGWSRATLGDLLANIDSGHSPVCLARRAHADEWAVLKLGAVTYCRYDPTANKALSPETPPLRAHEVKVGDLLFARKNTRDLVGATALVRSTPRRMLLPDLIFRLQTREDAPVDKTFLHQLLIWPTKRKQIQTLAHGSAGSMPNISKARLRTAVVETPPISMQREFAGRVRSVEGLRQTHLCQLAELDNFFACLQSGAFAGEL